MSTRIYTPSRREFEPIDLFWLAYLVFLIIQPAEQHSTVLWVKTALVAATFIPMYFFYLRSSSLRVKLALNAGMVLLGVVTLPWNGGGTAFIIYAAALLPFAIAQPALVFPVVFAEAVLIGVEEWRFHFAVLGIAINIFFTVVVGITNLFFAQKLQADCKLRMQGEEIEALAAVAERERIARDLHDVLGHTLSVVVLKSELASRLLQRELSRLEEGLDPSTLQRAQTEIADVERIARSALGEVREAIGGYRARGLAAEIDAARSTLDSAGVTLHAEGDLRPAGLSAAEETVLALALREAVTNIVRHARATSCSLRLVIDADRYRLSIKDNGQHGNIREGNGLRGMRERIEALGGDLRLTCEAGTHLQIDLPQRASS